MLGVKNHWLWCWHTCPLLLLWLLQLLLFRLRLALCGCWVHNGLWGSADDTRAPSGVVMLAAGQLRLLQLLAVWYARYSCCRISTALQRCMEALPSHASAMLQRCLGTEGHKAVVGTRADRCCWLLLHGLQEDNAGCDRP